MTDLTKPIVAFSATILDSDNPLNLSITDAIVDRVAQDDVVETFDFSSVGLTVTTVDRFGNSLTPDEVVAYELTSGGQIYVREVGDSEDNTVFEIVANPTSEFSALDFDLTDYAGLNDFALAGALSTWTSQTNTTVPNQVAFSGFSSDGGIPAGQETVLATFTSATDPDFAISGIELDGAAEPDISVGEIPAASTNGNVTVFEVARNSDTYVDAYKPIDEASEDAIGAFDALQALRLAVGLTKSDGTAEWHDYLAADINKDGRVGADDALDILKFAVGLTDGSPADWVFVDGDADWSGVTRSNTSYDEGVMLEDVLVDTSINMTGILVGDLDGSYSAAGAQGDMIGDTSAIGTTPVGETVSLSYFSDGSARGAVRYFYPEDLDGSAGQEVIIAGFETQPNTEAEYSNTALFILDVSAGNISDITTTLMPISASSMEGVGDVVWGDFNNDGTLDFFTTAYTDMDFAVNAYSFTGTSNGFDRNQIDSATWQHGASALDINLDGYDDVYVVGYSGANLYFGSASGLLEYDVAGDFSTGSGVSLADFLNNGQVQAVVVDAGVVGTNVADTVLFDVAIDDGAQTVTLTNLATLPSPLLEDSAFDEVFKMNAEHSHDVRVEALDFNSDGLMDVIVFSRGSYVADLGEWVRVSQLQFLENEGGGVFSDVTSTVLPDYNFESNVSYEPVFDDFNKDGYLDIFISEADFGSPHTSSVFLLGTSDGRFEEYGRDYLSALIPENGGMATVVEDANEDFWLLVGSQSVGVDGRQENLTLYPVDFA